MVRGYFFESFSQREFDEKVLPLLQPSDISPQTSLRFVQDNESKSSYGVMWWLQVKEYLTYVWREVMSGNTDYESMTPEMVIAKQNS